MQQRRGVILPGMVRRNRFQRTRGVSEITFSFHLGPPVIARSASLGIKRAVVQDPEISESNTARTELRLPTQQEQIVRIRSLHLLLAGPPGARALHQEGHLISAALQR